MAERAKFENYKGKEIYYIDYSNLKTNEEFLEAIKETNAFRIKTKEQGKKDLLMLVNMNGSYVYGDVLKEIKRSGQETKPLTKKTAVVGITGSKKVLLNIINTVTNLSSKPFDNLEEAKEWLIQ